MSRIVTGFFSSLGTALIKSINISFHARKPTTMATSPTNKRPSTNFSLSSGGHLELRARPPKMLPERLIGYAPLNKSVGEGGGMAFRLLANQVRFKKKASSTVRNHSG